MPKTEICCKTCKGSGELTTSHRFSCYDCGGTGVEQMGKAKVLNRLSEGWSLNYDQHVNGCYLSKGEDAHEVDILILLELLEGGLINSFSLDKSLARYELSEKGARLLKDSNGVAPRPKQEGSHCA